MRFDSTDLQIFLHVCEAGSMTGAAARSHLTLAAVSARMRGLEDHTGIDLLQRHARGVSPTRAGEVLARHARLVLDQVQRLDRDLLHAGSASDGARRSVLLANSSALARPLAEGVAALCGAGGERHVLVRESSSEASVQAIRSGAADLAIVSDAVDTRGLATLDLGPDPLVLVVARAHPLAPRESVRFAHALGEPWIAWGEQSALSTHLLVRALRLGVQMQPKVTYPTLDGVLHFVGSGLGLSVLPQAIVAGRPARDSVACVRLDEEWADRRLLVAYLEGGEPLRQVWAEQLQRHWPQA